MVEHSFKTVHVDGPFFIPKNVARIEWKVFDLPEQDKMKEKRKIAAAAVGSD